MSRASASGGEPRTARLVAELQARPAGDELVLWWLGQSGFAIRVGDGLAIVDPYLSDSLTTKYANTATPHVRMMEKVLEPADLARAPIAVVASTHHHTDHLDPETLRPLFAACQAAGRPVPLLVPEACRALASERSGLLPSAIVGIDGGLSAEVGGFVFTGVPAAHGRLEHDEHGHCKFLGYVIRGGRWTVYHSGDGVVYDGLAEQLRGFGVDVALLPINGKVGNMSGADAARLAREAGMRLVVPCHYDMFTFNTVDPWAEFVPACERLGQPYRVLALGEGLVVDG